MTIADINELINKINDINNFDLTMRWVGDNIEVSPSIQVYEESEQHVLCYGSPSDIDKLYEDIIKGADSWGLQTP